MAIVYGTNIENNAVPSLDLRFSDRKDLVDTISGKNLISFSRSSTGTYVGSDGLIKTAASNEARFDHNPATGESLGLLVEEARTNNALRSDSISYATSSGSVTVNTTNTLAPDGTFTAVAYAPSQRPAGNTDHEYGAIYPPIGSCPDGNIISIYAKMGPDPTLKYIHLRIFTTDYITTFNLENGTFTEGSPSAFPSTMTDVGNGWWRLTVRNLTGSSTSLLRIYIGDNTSIINNPTGDEIYLWGLQNETGSFPTSYIPTSGSTVTRSADVVQITGSNFSSWYNQSAGTVFVETKKVDDTGASGAWYFGPTGAPRWWSYSPGYTQAFDGSGGSGVINTNYSGSRDLMKYAVAISNTAQTHAGVINGGSVVNGGWDSIVGVTQLDLGFRRDNNDYLNGRISRLTYYPQRLQNSTLQKLTS